MSETSASFALVEAHTRKEIRLAMQRLWLAGKVLPAGARLTVQHIFRSEEKQALEAIYCFPLPRDAALRAFRIVGDGFEVHSELKPREEAVKIFERGIAAGSLAALSRVYGDGLVNLTVGNLRPNETVTVYLELLAGVELRDDGFRFRFPFTLAPSYHPQARTAEVDESGELELPAAEFGDVILPVFRKKARSLHEVGFGLTLTHRAPLAEIGSPSHSIGVRQGESETEVTLGQAKDCPNRDLVLDVRYQAIRTQVLAGTLENARRSFAAIVPSTEFGAVSQSARRLVILLDHSGSMKGAPLDQARKAIEACLAGLSEDDTFGLAAFCNDVETMNSVLVPASRENREIAMKFLAGIKAQGGTELAQGITRSAQMLEGGGDIMLLTDGQVFGTEAILAKVRATGIRLFCLGIGSASQDRFLALLARETGGISRFVTPRERVDLTAVDLFASIGRPVATGLKVNVAVQPEPADSVFAGTPVLLFGEIADGDADEIGLTWNGGSVAIRIPAGQVESGETMRLLRGSRLIADWESRYPAEEANAPLERRKQSRVAMRLIELSEIYGLASREMALVAVVQRAGDHPGQLPETRVVPVGMPQDTRFGAYFTLQCAALGHVPAPTATPQIVASSSFGALRARAPSRMARNRPSPPEPVDTTRGLAGSDPSRSKELVALAAMLEPDGGMPGDTPETRAARSIAALLAFVADGTTTYDGPFRLHVRRLVAFWNRWTTRVLTQR